MNKTAGFFQECKMAHDASWHFFSACFLMPRTGVLSYIHFKEEA